MKKLIYALPILMLVFACGQEEPVEEAADVTPEPWKR